MALSRNAQALAKSRLNASTATPRITDGMRSSLADEVKPEIQIPYVRKIEQAPTLGLTANDNAAPTGKQSASPVDENETALAKLMARIHRAERVGKSFTLRTAEEIALYLDLDTAKQVNNLVSSSRLPFHRDGNKLALRIDAYERFVALQQWCSMNGVDFDKHAREWGFPKPSEKKPPVDEGE
jgi:hypothetical protein